MIGSRKIEFPGSAGSNLAARLDLPVEPRAFALFAHCFTCGKDAFAAPRIADALTARGIAVLRFDFTGIGSSEGDFANNQHICGTVTMGSNPKSSVCDGWGRAHDHENLFLVGTGVIPTCGTCNSTENGVALALRTAAHLLQQPRAGSASVPARK